ncbi:MAG TPA: hypothetical protein PLU41_08335 [Acidobacteriota bacterium]|nr:hypothetical protein [Acidobacteriota bacterium]HQP74017.1 hypothetical protein [Acidobacteriota bacterium]
MRLRLIHWHAEEAAAHAAHLRTLGFEVDATPPAGLSLLKELSAGPPDALLVVLDRLPSQGRDLALLVRQRRATARLPIVMVGGAPEKIAPIQAVLPDAVYSTWDELPNTLPGAMSAAPLDPPSGRPKSAFAAYAGRPLAAKLGIKTGMTVGLADAPPGFAATLGVLPAGVCLRDGIDDCNLGIAFFLRAAELERRLPGILAAAGDAPVWLAWPKRASGQGSDLSQAAVRAAGLAAGWVDYKICRIDATWSALLFRWRGCGRKSPR